MDRMRICTAMSLLLGLVLCGPIVDAVALPTSDELLQELQISDGDRQKTREGIIVSWTASEGSERELAMGMALVVKTKAEKVVELFREASGFKSLKSVITAHGRITGNGTPADFARVTLEPN